MTHEEKAAILSEATNKLLLASREFCNEVADINDRESFAVLSTLAAGLAGCMLQGCATAAKPGSPPEAIADMSLDILKCSSQSFCDNFVKSAHRKNGTTPKPPRPTEKDGEDDKLRDEICKALGIDPSQTAIFKI